MRIFARRGFLVASLCLVAATIVSCQQASKLPEGLYARMKTSKGEVLLKLDHEGAPLTVCNFVGLATGKLDAANGKPFYDGLGFHRVVKDFVVQGGDPSNDGSGGPGYAFADEFSPNTRHDGPGIISMANAGPNTNGSQFFITLKETPWLDGVHSAFGRVVEGMEVVRKIEQGDKIESVRIERSGAAAKAFKVDQKTWNGLNAKALEAGRKRAEARRADDIALIAQTWPDLKADEDGIFQKVLAAGTGPVPETGATVQVTYKGTFLSGQVFDASELHGGPYEFRVGQGQIITGWDKVVASMRKGERRFVVIPPELAYGEKGAGGVIPPNAFLAFDLTLVGIK